MFAKKHRLAKTKDVKAAFARGRSFFNPYFSVNFLAQPGQASRFTIVVSTKVSKQAVRRNRLKRILREFIGRRLKNFTPGDYVVRVKPKALAVKETDLLKIFEQFAISFRPNKHEIK